MPIPNDINADLFPVPNQRRYLTRELVFPAFKPGISLASTTTLQRILTENYKSFHVFVNEKSYHNHTAHAALTLWSLGASPATLEGSYKENIKIQRAAFESPGPITRQTWKDHLGDENYYDSYHTFFQDEVKEKSFSALLEEYVFGADANVVSGADVKDKPGMVPRFVAGLLHPMIHTGFGVEFGLPGTFAEGLAQTAVHRPDSDLILSTWFIPPAPSQMISEPPTNTKADVHAFTILSRVLADPQLGNFENPGREELFFATVVEQYGERIVRYVEEWTLDVDGDLEKKVLELIWIVVLIYAVPGLEKGGTFNADFLLMHFVTSSLFLSPIVAEVKRSSQIELLRAYFATALAWYVGRGRPQLDIAAIFSNPAFAHPTAPGPQPTPHAGVNPSPAAPEAVTPNSWLAIMQSALAHPDDHVAKIMRTLSEYAIHFGLTPPGAFEDTELKDAGLIDGTLFVRAAGLTLNRMGWVREGQTPAWWDLKGFFAVSE